VITLLERFAQIICETTWKIIGYEVIITDPKAVIIGSSNPERIGTIHQPSIEAMKLKQEIFTDEIEATNWPGVKPGVTLPISLGGEVVGSIAIAGNHKEVAKYGHLVQKHAEIFLHEQVLTESSLARERALSDLVSLLASFRPSEDDPSVILVRGKELGFNLNKPRICLAIELNNPNTGETGEMVTFNTVRNTILPILRNEFNDPEDIVAHIGEVRFSVIKSLPSRIVEDPKTMQDKFIEAYQALQRNLDKYSYKVYVGIGNLAKGVEALHESYKNSWKAINIASDKALGIYSIGSYRIEELLSTVNKSDAKSFVSQTLGDLEKLSDWNEIRRTFMAWIENPFNPRIVSKKLNIHRNTLNYRLDKIKKTSHLNPRNFKDAFCLFLAITMQSNKNI
jgi:carbohydrate diacid regulator